MSIFGSKSGFDWKYILREILLIFVGISLAIWFNNWNTANKTSRNKEVVIAKIKEEIGNNQKELIKAQKINQQISSAFDDFSKVYNGNSSQVITTPEELAILQNKYPKFFRVKDSIEIKEGVYRYNGDTFIELELPELTEIAWETARSINISNEFKYECLYNLQGMYSLQRRVQNNVDKAADMLQAGKINELIKILDIINQLDLQLQDDYKNMMQTIDDCR